MRRPDDDSSRPWVEVVLAMSADGKIADASRSPQRIASARDRALLDDRLSAADAALYGAGTLRALRRGIQLSAAWQGGETRPVVNIVASARAEFDLSMPFFEEDFPRWLITGAPPGDSVAERFEEVLVFPALNGCGVDWPSAMRALVNLGIKQVCCGGGGDLASLLVRKGLVDEYWITVAPLFIGGRSAPTPLDGEDVGLGVLPDLTLVSWEVVDSEVFLRYRVAHGFDSSS